MALPGLYIMNMENLDIQLINELQKDCRKSITSLAQKLKVSRKTIANRIKDLEDKKIIESYTILADYDLLGFPYYTTFYLKIEPKKLSSCMEKITAFPEIHWISLIMGDYDLHLMGLFRARNDLQEFITEKLGKVEGVLSIQSDLILARYFKNQVMARKKTVIDNTKIL